VLPSLFHNISCATSSIVSRRQLLVHLHLSSDSVSYNDASREVTDRYYAPIVNPTQLDRRKSINPGIFDTSRVQRPIIATLFIYTHRQRDAAFTPAAAAAAAYKCDGVQGSRATSTITDNDSLSSSSSSSSSSRDITGDTLTTVAIAFSRPTNGEALLTRLSGDYREPNGENTQWPRVHGAPLAPYRSVDNRPMIACRKTLQIGRKSNFTIPARSPFIQGGLYI